MAKDVVQNCGGHLRRRTLLGAGIGVAAGGLASISRVLASANPDGPPTSVILLWMDGGPSQLETFDPHPGTRIGGDVSAIDTSLPGLSIADTLPGLASRMHHGSLVRSVVGHEGNHERAAYHIRTGFRPDPTIRHPSLGGVIVHADSVTSDLPRHVSLVPGVWPGVGGYLGGRYDAMRVDAPGEPLHDVEPGVAPERFERRMRLLREVVDPAFAGGAAGFADGASGFAGGAGGGHPPPRGGTFDAATRLMSAEQRDAFDIADESRSTRDAFGDHDFGRGVLTASRLIDVGVRCVEVTLSGWDSHAANDTLQRSRCAILDPAISALLDRLADRDRLDRTLVVVAGEFGRTPDHNPAAGRDHWVHGFSVFLAGGGIRPGRVVGATSPRPDAESDPARAVERPVSIDDLHATVLRALDLDPALELDTPVGRPMKRSEGTPIAELIGDV